MAPTGILDRLKTFYSGPEETKKPAISLGLAVALLVLYTVLYVLPFYATSTTRPSPHLSRDAPSVIRGRITSVTWSCAMCSLSTFVLLSSVDGGTPVRSLHNMGYLPAGLLESAKALALTCILFLGPLFEAGIAEGEWRDWVRLRGVTTVLGSWIGYRNLIAGPVTEEILFRSCAVPLFVLARASLSTTLIGTPIIFGLAHIHHFYEFRITHPHTPLTAAILRSVFQLGYTTLFGAYATFVYLRTGSLLAVILIHAFCNWMGLPRFWGRVSGPETVMGPDVDVHDQKRDEAASHAGATRTFPGPKRLGILWSFAYYIILVVGAVGWYKMLWSLTESDAALVKF